MSAGLAIVDASNESIDISICPSIRPNTMSGQPTLQTCTAPDYRQWEGDWELIAGYPVAMAPSPVLEDFQFDLSQCSIDFDFARLRKCQGGA